MCIRFVSYFVEKTEPVHLVCLAETSKPVFPSSVYMTCNYKKETVLCFAGVFPKEIISYRLFWTLSKQKYMLLCVICKIT